MKHVYLSLAEGVTDFSKDKEKLKLKNLTIYSNHLNAKAHQIIKKNPYLVKDIRTNQTNRRLTDKKATLLDTNINNDKLPKEYSAGGVLNVKYSLDTLNSMSNNELLNDLNIMCRIYNQVLSAEQSSTVKHDTRKAQIQDKYDFSNIPLTKVHSTKPTNNEPPHQKLQSSTNKKPDYAKQNKRNMREGNAGEIRVKEYEKDYLIKSGRKDLATKVTKESDTNDRLGYDVLSFKTDGTPLYIEVKTTPNSNGDTPFPITWRELGIARKYPNNFRIYRIYNAKKHRHAKKDHLWYHVYTYDTLAKMYKKPESYLAYPDSHK